MLVEGEDGCGFNAPTLTSESEDGSASTSSLWDGKGWAEEVVLAMGTGLPGLGPEHLPGAPCSGTGSISLQSKGLSRVFSNTTVQKRQFFGTQLSL